MPVGWELDPETNTDRCLQEMQERYSCVGNLACDEIRAYFDRDVHPIPCEEQELAVAACGQEHQGK